MSDDARPLLVLDHVSHAFPAGEPGATVPVLQDVDLTVNPGEVVAILGKSGCGKSTLLRIMCGLIPPSSGTVYYRGRPVERPAPGISLVFQTFALFPWLTVLQNVELGLEAQGVKPDERRRRAQEAIDMIGLSGFESAYPRELSGGMRQRVGFARALVVNPDVLLMDEPFSALDVPTSETLRSDLLDLWIEHLIPTQAIIMVSHNIEEALMLADRIVIFEANPGRIKTEVPVALKHPRDRESPRFRQLVERIYNIMTLPVGTEDAQARAGRIGIAYRLPTVNVAQMTGLLEELNQPDNQGRVELSALAEAMHLQLDDLFAVVDVLEIMDFAHVSSGQLCITRHGRAFVEADIQPRKIIFADHLIIRVPLAAHIRRVLDDRPFHRAPEARFLRELEDFLSEEEAERVLAVVIDWARYAEIFAYDYNTGMLSTESPEEELAP